MNLNQLKLGETVRIIAFQKGSDKKYRQSLLAMGLTPGISFQLTRIAPFGDPVEITLRGYALSLRKQEAEILEIERVEP